MCFKRSISSTMYLKYFYPLFHLSTYMSCQVLSVEHIPFIIHLSLQFISKVLTVNHDFDFWKSHTITLNLGDFSKIFWHSHSKILMPNLTLNIIFIFFSFILICISSLTLFLLTFLFFRFHGNITSVVLIYLFIKY